ncbi:DUF3397 domain-containing protein [Bacillus sp. B15-48]|uniref:DUF3397 domain-containing protein n=1 Tax=Bacillus sp. B15-48 TaxID=1548601 RepID=UPI00193F1D01|nr:DUF3397 domain-containing protein [Bacillus sp. B15-48]MBM4764032.1 DUF3397 family protein [Bacillus sp. B15-48]
MTDFISGAVALFVTVPLIGYIVMFILSKQVTKNHRLSVLRAIDFSTLLFIISVHFLIHIIWGQSFLWVIFLFLILLAFCFVLLHWKYKQEINFPRVFKGYWRMNFFLFLFAYLVLIIVGLYQRVSGIVAFL